VEHGIFLFNLVTLFAGLVVAGRLFRRWATDRRPLSFWQFFHFVGFTFTMAVAAADAYGVVNLGLGSQWTLWWSAAVMVGAAVMLFCFPHLSRAEVQKPRTPKFTAFWALLTLFPLAGALALPLINDYGGVLLVLGAAFVPFFGAIGYGLTISTRPHERNRWSGWATFLGLAAVGLAEVGWVVTNPPQKGYYFFTLPLAYLYTVWITGKSASRPAASAVGTMTLPDALGRDFGLTPREREIAGGIVKGQANKELAFELGLSENTVRNHISNLYRKLGIQKRMDLVLLVQKYQGQ
jgi:DNA-binding CsgD family transcriptional regulator